MLFSLYWRMRTFLFLFISVQLTVLNAQPISTRTDITIKELATINSSSLRISRNPVSEDLYILENNGNIKKVIIGTNGLATFTTVYQTSDHGLNSAMGMAFGSNGNLYLVSNQSSQVNTWLQTATIVKGVITNPESEERTWSIIAQTVEYNYGNTYNHRMSGIAVDPNNDFIYVNSGARTDHGEVRQGLREVGLTSIILKLPTDGENILLQNDREWLRENNYLMAEGIRNVFDLAFNSNGDLISVENSGDRDDPEEMNWIREGYHYGFPWRQGGNRNPQQDTPYVPQQDPLLSPNAWGGGQGQLYITFSNDPAFPQKPDTLILTEPIPSSGPDADRFRDTVTGNVKDASNLGELIYTLSAHRSPNGIVFDVDSALVEDLAGGGFVISLNSGGQLQPLGDSGQDLLHVSLVKVGVGDFYAATVTRLVSGFDDPLGIEISGNKIYIVETGLWGFPQNNDPKLWEITLPSANIVGISEKNNSKINFNLQQNYPNPFNPITTIKYSIPVSEFVYLTVYDVLGNKIATLVNGKKDAGFHEVIFNAKDLSSGFYFYTLIVGSYQETKKLLLMK